MIVVIPEDQNVEALHRALRGGGFILRVMPGGIFQLHQVNQGRPTCEQCERPASIKTAAEALCSAHAAAQIEGVTP